MSKPPNKRQHLLPDRFRHPSAMARDQFIDNAPLILFDVASLNTMANPVCTLHFRLEHAFDEGWRAAAAHYRHQAEVKGLKLPL